jgi:two-component system response regulator FixJ
MSFAIWAENGKSMIEKENRNVCVIDDDDAVRDSLQALLSNAGFNVLTYGESAGFLEEYSPESTSCALIDVRMPGIDGMELLEQLAAMDNMPPIVIITGHGEVEMAVRAMKIGAFDFIEKPFEPDALIERVNAAVRWGEDQIAEKRKVDEAKTRLMALTPRETDVLKCLLTGLSNKAIARELDLSPRTVEVHRARVMDKTKAESLSHLVRLSLKAGLEPEG